MKRAAIYTRISDDEEALRKGVGRQEDDCRQMAEERGWRVVAVFSDNSRSAFKKNRKRPGYLELMESMKEGLVDVVVAWHPDRLHRDLAELETFIDAVEAAGVEVATVLAGTYDLSTPSGRFVARNLGAAARYESEHRQERIQRKHLQIASEGQPSSGKRAYGYEYDPEAPMGARRTVVPEEAAVIRWAADAVLCGVSMRSICRDLDEIGVLSATGKRWVPVVLKGILTSGRIAGQREHLGKVVAEGQWEAIISPAQVAQLRAVLIDPDRRRLKAGRYLLSGLVRCGRCGHVMVTRAKVNNRRGYACQSGPPWYGCGRMFIQAEPLEAIIRAAVVEALDGPAVAEMIDEADDDAARAAEAEISESEAQLEELAAAYGSKVISLAEWMAARQPVEARMEAARSTIVEKSSQGAVVRLLRPGAGIGERFMTLDAERQRAVVAALVEYVPVHPHDRSKGKWFQPDRIGDPQWRV